jgi:hypothetical protein
MMGYTATGGGSGGGKKCAADYSNSTPCCSQSGDPGPVPLGDQCTSDEPVCVNYIYDKQMGHCTVGNPAPPVLLKDWNSDVEFVYSSVASNWAEPRCAVDAVNGSVIAMQQPCMWNLYNRAWQPLKGAPPPFIDNLRSSLTAPGEFYYDRARAEVLYVPLEGQDMSKAEAVVAVEEQLVVHNVSSRHTWQGVTFEHATWLRPMQGRGYVEQQSAACNTCAVGSTMQPGCGGGDIYTPTPGAVTAISGKDITFDSCTFQHLGAYAGAASGGSQRVSWVNCTFRDLSAGALMLGGLDTCSEKDAMKWDRDFYVADSKITNIPVEYTGATAIFLGYVENSTVEVSYNMYNR